MSKKRSVLIFGGAFDPPTLAHEAIIAACLALKQFDELWVMPSGDRTDKQTKSGDAHRVAMLDVVHRASFSGNRRLRISDFELGLPRPSSTQTTVQALKEKYPLATFWFAFGRDSYITMPTWPGGRTLQRQLPMVIFTSSPGAKPTAPNVLWLTIPDVYGLTSSTEARNAIHGGKDTSKLQVSPSVLAYIKQHGLYLI